MVIDHIGIVVKSIKIGIQHWKDIFGYRQLTEIVVNTRQKVKVVFLVKTNSLQVKLVEPIEKGSGLYNFAKRGGGLHHLCFKCKDINDEISRLKEKRIRVLTSPQPGEAFNNANIAFLFAKQGLNIEIIDTDKRAKLIMDIEK